MGLVAALTWDPQIRGVLILGIAILALCGSCYLLLATNLGARLGLLVAVACLSGWMVTLGIIWTVYGIGPKGTEPTWKAEAVIQGPLGPTARPPLNSFQPKTWEELPEGNAERAEAQAAVDDFLQHGTEQQPGVFKTSDEYILQDAFNKGGKVHGIHLFGKGITWKHDPHYAIFQVQPTLKQETQPGQAPPTPKPDPSKPVVHVLLVRDLGSLRRPPIFVTLAALIIFVVSLYALHRRDKEAMIARGVLPAPAR